MIRQSTALALIGSAGWLVALAGFGTAMSLAFAAGFLLACAALALADEVEIR